MVHYNKHRSLEFVVGYLTIFVNVYFCKYFVPELVVLLVRRLEHLLQLTLTYVATAVCVEHFEGSLKVLLGKKLFFV